MPTPSWHARRCGVKARLSKLSISKRKAVCFRYDWKALRCVARRALHRNDHTTGCASTLLTTPAMSHNQDYNGGPRGRSERDKVGPHTALCCGEAEGYCVGLPFPPPFPPLPSPTHPKNGGAREGRTFITRTEGGVLFGEDGPGFRERVA